MRLTVITVLVALFSLQASSMSNRNNYQQYIRLSERYFDRQNFDSCLYYNYILAHYCSQSQDTVGVVSAWYYIGIINLLQKKFTNAQAAQIIANRYIKGNTNFYNAFKTVYNSILNVKNNEDHLPLSLNLSGFGSIHLRKLYYLSQLHKTAYDGQIYQFSQLTSNLKQLISDMKVQADTNWYGYAKANMLMAEYFYNINDYSPCFAFYETALRIYEKNDIFTADYIKAYYHYLYSLLATGQIDKRNFSLQKLEHGNLINKNRAGYYFIKGEASRFGSKTDAIEVFVQAYYSTNDLEIKNDLIKRLISSYTFINQYQKAKLWLGKLDTTDLNIYDKVWMAFNCVKLKDIALGNAIMKNVENDKKSYITEIYYFLGKFYAELKNLKKAEKYFQLYKVRFLKTYKNNNFQNMMGFSDLGYFYWYGKADYKKSLEYYHKAVFELVHTRAPDNYYQMPDINKSFGDKELARELGNKGECFYEVSHLCKTKAETILDLKASLDNLELSEIVAHRYKMSLSSDEQRYQYADGIQHRYPYIINVCIVLYSQTGDTNYARKAFEYSEKSKSSMLLSTMRGVNAHNMHLLPDDLKNAEDRIWTKTELVSQYLKESYNAANVNRAKIDEYNTKLVILRSQQDSLLRIFKQKYSAYYNARYNDNVITADSLQKLLKPNEAALEYTVSSKNIVIYMVTRNEFKVFTDTIGPGFFADIEAYRQQLSDYTYDYRDSVIRNYALLANRLYKRLVKPAESYIKGKKILIIPDDVLTQIPFETLVTQPVPDKVQSSFRTMAYLVKEHVVYYNYSGTLYAMNRGTHVYPHAKLLAVAPKYENKTSYQQVVRDTSHTDSTSLLPIPWALDEVKEIHKLFGGKILSKGSATEQHFKEIAGKYDILHLAAHGLVNNNYPMFSKLVFTGDKDSTNEGYLNTYEIYNMHINAPLVVLSACNSGYGKLHKGEGIISLARGFFTAGAKSIVMTLWAVSDKSSSQIVKNFYGSLSSNQNIGEAMQKSKIQYLEQTDEEGAHPYFWSGYIVLGNAGSSFEPISPTYYYILWATGGFIIFMLWVMRKKIWLKFSTFWEYSRF